MDVLDKIRRDLKENSDERVKEGAQHYFKEKIKVYGIKNATVLKIARDAFKDIKHLKKKEIFYLCEDLLKSGYMEESFIAFSWAERISKYFEEEDFKTFERWIIRYVNNWASCDTFCNHTIGNFIKMYPSYVGNLKKWTCSKNRWVRRGAAVSLVLPARKGTFLKDVLGIADLLLEDKDDLVQKGYGWVLKEASKKHQKEVFCFVLKNRKIMPRTALRYAIEKMPEKLRKKAMERKDEQ
jgi:3-methyladenine DNA glycosylase AlkD